MAKIAKEVLKMGFVVAALPGNVVTADDDTIAKWGWADKIEDDGKPDRTASPTLAQPVSRSQAADPNLPAGS